MLNRRQTLLSFAAMAAPTLVTAAPTNATRYYTAKTAPDALTRAILANPILSLDLPPGADAAAAIHSMFPQLIEQNFASLTNKGIARLLGNLSADELRDLAGIYVATAGAQGRLLDLFALRLTGRDMGRLTPYFGYEPVYGAVWQSAPDKSNEFAQFAIADASSGGPATTNASPNVGMTITQIYNTYRTSAIGGMSVKAALYETAMYASSRLAGAYYAGNYVGAQLSGLIQTYAPALHDAIGQSIYNIVNNVSLATGNPIALGQAQASSAGSFYLGNVGGLISTTGGDYGVCTAWQSLSGGGSGGCAICVYDPF